MSAPSAVALVGMAGRFPGADDIETLWANLLDGVISTRSLDDRELLAAGVSAESLADPRYVKVCAPVDGAEYFDAEFFGVPAAEAKIIDPQQRLFLECSWSALEAAGYPPGACPRVAGVFGGCCLPTYLLFNIAGRPDLVAEHGVEAIVVGNDKDALASRVAYQLGLTGPAICVQAFSATSLTAVHLAVQSLLTFETDIALAGAAAVKVPQLAGYRYEPGGLGSPDGVCRSLDADAAGTVVGNGVAVVVLKRLEDALRDGDHVHCVIRGSAVTSGGRRPGYTAPGRRGQAEAIAEALAAADVDPATVGYVEAHALGSALGDSIELSVLAEVYGGGGEPVVVASAKANIGHLEAASGVTGLIKAALAVERAILPPQPNVSTPNPAFESPPHRLQVNTTVRKWPARPGPRRAAVNSFGLGGINAHVVLEEAPDRPARTPEQVAGPHLVPVSARTPDALAAALEALRETLSTTAAEMCDIAHTLQSGRCAFEHRAALVCRDRWDAVAALDELGRPRLLVPDRSPPGESACGAGLPAGLLVLARRWVGGADVDWQPLHEGRPRHRVPLPTYPFARNRHWVEPAGPPGGGTGTDEDKEPT